MENIKIFNIRPKQITDGKGEYTFIDQYFCSQYSSINAVAQDPRLEHLAIYASHHENDIYHAINNVLCHNRALKSLELSFKEELVFGEDQWVKSEQIALIADGFKNNKTLQSFTLTNGKLTSVLNHPRLIETLINGINEGNLKSASFSRLSDFLSKQLCKSLANNKSITHLSLKNTALSPAIETLFRSNTTITHLSLVKTLLRDDAIKSLSNVIRSSTILQTLELRSFDTHTLFTSISEIYDSLTANRSLKKLVFKSERLLQENRNFLALWTAIKDHPTLESFEITGCSCPVLDLLTEFLIDNKTLKAFRLGRGKLSKYRQPKYSIALTENNCKQLADLIQKNTTLTSLAINGAAVYDGSISLKIIAGALKNNSTLLTFDTSYSVLAAESIPSLAEILNHNKTLRTLNLRRIKPIESIPIESMIKFKEALINNRTLTSLDMSECMIGDPVTASNFTEFFKEIIRKNTTLMEIKYQDSEANEFPINSLISSLKCNNSLTSLDLLSLKGAGSLIDQNEVAELFLRNRSITHLKVNVQHMAIMKPYIRRNGLFMLNMMVLLYNVIREQETIFPNEIWLQIFKCVPWMTVPLNIVFHKRRD